MLFQKYLIAAGKARSGELIFEEVMPPEPCCDGCGGAHKPPSHIGSASDDHEDDFDDDNPSNDPDPLAPFRNLLRNIAAASEICIEAKNSSDGFEK